MPRRDGTPTEEELARQRAGQGPGPTRSGTLPPRAAAVAALAATSQAAGAAASAPPYIAPAVTVAAINAAAAGIIGSFDRFLDQRRQAQEEYVNGLLEAEVSELPEDQRLALVGDELDREKQFAGKARQRLDRDLPKALRIADKTVREAEVRKILDRERRYMEQREAAMATRTLGAAEQRRVEQLSPHGGYWHLSPHVREHTLDCLAMGGKVWPHSVLRTYHPPLHGGCPCEIWTIQEAEQAGELTHPGQYATPDESLQAMQVVEADFDDDEFAEELAILEAFYDARWPSGTTKAGQFRPKRGGDPGSVLRHPHLARMHLPHLDVAPVMRLDRELDVRDLRVKDLREGDHVMVNGNLERITKVHPSPGLLELEHTGLAHIDRESIQGIPGEQHGRAAHRFKSGTRVQSVDEHGMKIGPIYTVQDHNPDGSVTVVDSEGNQQTFMSEEGLTDKTSDKFPNPRGGAKPPAPARPELPQFGPNDRFDLRHGENGQLVMFDRQHNKPYAVWDGTDAANVAAVHRMVQQENEAHRRNVASREPAPPPRPGGTTYEQVEKDLLTRKMGKAPTAAGPLLPGFHYAGPTEGGKPSYQHKVHGDTLHLQQGFFRQGRDRREAIIFKHLGTQLADSVGEAGIKNLGDEHLSSRQRMIDTYFALNTPARERMVALHPEASRLVAQAAHERGLPLHPEAAKLIRRQSPGDSAPAEHPAHELAKRQVGLGGQESQQQLQEAGYDYGGAQNNPDGTVTFVFHNHEHGTSITTTHKTHGESGLPTTAAHATINPPVPQEERNALVGITSDKAIQRMLDQGYSPGYTSSGDWMQFVHPNGQGRALRLRDTGPTMEVTDVKSFTPPDKDVADARNVVIRRNPLQAIRPGDDYQTVHAALENRNSGFSVAKTALDSPHTPDGAGFSEYRDNGQPNTRRIVVHFKDGKVIAVGHGSLTDGEQGRIVTQAEHEQQVQAYQAERQRERAERDQQTAAIADSIRAATASGDTKALQAALEGRSTNDAVSLLRQHGFELRGRRRAGRGTSRSITYTLRGPRAETVKITGPYTFGVGQGITKIAITGNPQGGDRTRLPEGTAPKNVKQLLSDALGRADELGQRYGAGVHVTGIIEGGVSRGAAAHHEFNGTIAIRKNHEGAIMRDYLSKRTKGEPLSESEHLRFYGAVETLQHELNHGIGKRGGEPGGLAFGPQHYQGAGKNVEEALTEEMAHVLAAEWLQSHGMTDVLAAVKRNPQHYDVLGTYFDYRIQLKRLLDDAGVPEAERRALLERWKFQASPEERNAEIAQLAGAAHVSQAMFGEPRRRSEMRRNFEPVLRPDLSHIDDGPSFTTNITGRVIRDGEAVAIPDGDKVLHGVVTGIRDGEVRVRTEDGIEMWYPQDRVR